MSLVDAIAVGIAATAVGSYILALLRLTDGSRRTPYERRQERDSKRANRAVEDSSG